MTQDEQDNRPRTPIPEITEEHRKQAEVERNSYDGGRPTVELPGSGGTVVGTGVNDWLDDEGNPKFGDKPDESAYKPADESGDRSVDDA